MPDPLRDAIDLADATRFSAAELSRLVAQLLADVEGVDHTAVVRLALALASIGDAHALLERVGDELRAVASS